jgi:hypothetical protein
MTATFYGFVAAVGACLGVIGTQDGDVTVDTSQLNPKQPQLALAADHSLHLAFGSDKEIYYCSAREGEAKFSAPKKVAGPGEFALGMRRGPRIAVAGDTIVITAIGGEKGGGRDGDVLAWVRRGAGGDFMEPVRVNDVEASAREGLHAMAASPDGALYCVWLDLRNKRTEITGAKSLNGGQSWSKNRLIYRSPDGSVCECCHPSVASAGDGSLYVMWRNSLAGNRDMYFATSTDGGTTFSKAAKLGQGNWPLKACPMDGGAIAARSTNEAFSVWRRDRTVYLTSAASQPEQKLGDGEQPWLALTSRGPLPVWISGRGGDLLTRLPGEPTATRLAGGARDPVCVANGNVAYIAWESGDKNQSTIHVRRLNVASSEGHPPTE